MNRRLTLVAALVMTLPLAAPTAYAQNYNNDNHRHDNGRHDNDRHDNNQGRWDPGQHNGYTMNGRWHYGRPPANLTNYQPGWHQWRRGDRLPTDFRTRYVVVNDWRNHRGLRAPPRGYHWVRDDRGEYILVGIATGLILSAILGNS